MKIMKNPFTGGKAILKYEKSELTFRKEKFQYINLFYECEDTKERFSTTEIDEINLSQVYNQYREKYGIPYTDEIKQTRQKYGLPAVKMSKILGFGENQYRLYENGDMPSETSGKVLSSIKNPNTFMGFVENARRQFASDEHEKVIIKVKNAINNQNKNLRKDLIFDSYSRGKVNGFAPQSYSKLKNILLFFIERLGSVFNTRMNKLLFYTDFLSYKNRGIAMSGLAYKAIQFGPVPLKWDRVYSLIDDVDNKIYEFPSGISGTKLCSDLSPDLNTFSSDEISILENVLDHFKDATATDISKTSHREDAWKDYINTDKTIDFDEAFSLKTL